ncbi:hypothetical protein FCV25MIE_05109 [Fagus crenata]
MTSISASQCHPMLSSRKCHEPSRSRMSSFLYPLSTCHDVIRGRDRSKSKNQPQLFGGASDWDGGDIGAYLPVSHVKHHVGFFELLELVL